MLKSLFGDLTPLREPAERRESPPDFVATAILESVAGEVNDRGQIVDRNLRDLFVTGSPAQAMRAHFAGSREEHGADQRIISLHDPAQMWAAAVIKALADASGQPVERLHLRDQTTLGTLAMIERTTLPRRAGDTLKVYHADVRGQGADVSAIPYALMERSDLTAVIVGPLPPSAIDEMLTQLRTAIASDTWHCPHLLFLLPVGASWIANKIEALSWPAGMQVQTLAEPLTSASAVWNKLLAHWNQIKGSHGAAAGPATQARVAPGGPGSSHAAMARAEAGPSGFGLASAFAPTYPPSLSPAPHNESVHTNNTTTVLVASPAYPSAASAYPSTGAGDAAGGHEATRRAPDAQRAASVLHELMLLDGLIFAALVDINSGQVVASEGRGPDIDRAAVAASEVLRVHRRTLRQLGHARVNDPVDEVLVTAGSRYHILRTLQAHPDFFILAVLDKLRSNLAMTRFRIMEAQQVLN
ncbi:hypothetical protein [Sphaerotilus mobilis]|uniref:Roadblock/LAMTOR2 domain-containing protein n=1 Tax=Sphaerotilus mobilis TaxID=47994 RepID=A0A4Q7LR93_9BURK|nr:hypothetical protein [Sphaerotilus mobilis]RZS56577.1 hypothetical protein EV685_1126 [Sphaerotilus mobilis]